MESVHKLLKIMSLLRDPQQGCLWDREQDFTTIAPYTIEEAYEVADAIERNDKEDLCAELGDLLFQVIYHARMAEEEGSFDFAEVVERLNRKLESRHTTRFSAQTTTGHGDQKKLWEQHKKAERLAGSAGGQTPSLLAAISLNLPALQRAEKLQTRAASIGFDWDELAPVMDKVEEELAELKQVLRSDGDTARCREELGDLLFACVNLARHMDVNAEAALRFTNHKFEQRFRFIENRLQAKGHDLETVSLETLDELWEAAKEEGC